MTATPHPASLAQDIDFLPAHYREHTAEKKGRAWRLSTIILLGMMLPVASFYQLRVRSKLHRELTALGPQCAMVEAYQTQLNGLEKKRGEMEAQARLIAYLRHPWPRSQIVAALLPTLPESVSLTSIQIEELAGSAVASPALVRNPHQQIQPQTSALPADADLESLRTRHDQAQVIVLLSGLTTDQSQLHEYLGHLARNRLFVKTELLSLESPSAKQAAAARTTEGDQFRARLIVCQGPGQPHGPKGKQDGAAEAQVHAAVAAGRLP